MTREEAIKTLQGKTKTKIASMLELREWLKFRKALDMAIKALEQEPKTGHWEICQDDDGMYGICNICGQDSDFTHYGEVYKYCPNCGAKMKSEEKG